MTTGKAFGGVRDGSRWYRGMIHAHTSWSDGRALPEQAIAAYKNAGYDFFAITDHNRIGKDIERWIEVSPLAPGWPPSTIDPPVFEAFRAAFPDAPWRVRDGKTEVRMTPVAELLDRFNEPGSFLLILGCEVTAAVYDADNVRRDVHMNLVGLDELVPRAVKAGLVETIQNTSIAQVLRETKNQVDTLAAALGNPPHLFFANHPQWRYYDVLPQDLVENPDIRFFEICNSGSQWLTEDPMPREGFDNDRFWDVVNTVRCLRGEPLLYGIATEDTHFYPGSGTTHTPLVFGDAWIGVRADALASADLFAAMDRGDFYASEGIDFDEVAFDRETKTLSVSVPAKAGVSYTVKFITTKNGAPIEPVKTVTLPAKESRPVRHVPVYSDKVGVVVKTLAFGKGEAIRASCSLEDDDLYIRARVESDEPAVYPNAINKMHPPMKVAWTQPYRQ